MRAPLVITKTKITVDSGWTQMTGTGSKAALAVFGTTYEAVNFGALDVGNLGLSALSTHVAALTTDHIALSGRMRAIETALFNAGILKA